MSLFLCHVPLNVEQIKQKVLFCHKNRAPAPPRAPRPFWLLTERNTRGTNMTQIQKSPIVLSTAILDNNRFKVKIWRRKNSPMQTTCPLEAAGTDLLTTEPREAVCTRAVGEKMNHFFCFLFLFLHEGSRWEDEMLKCFFLFFINFYFFARGQ